LILKPAGANWFLTANPEESGFDLIPKLRGSLTTDDRMTGWSLIPKPAGQTFILFILSKLRALPWLEGRGLRLTEGNNPPSVAALRPSSVALRRVERVEGNEGRRRLDSEAVWAGIRRLDGKCGVPSKGALLQRPNCLVYQLYARAGFISNFRP